MGDLLLWNAHRGREPLRRLSSHTRPVFNVLLSPDAATLLSISMDRLLQFWELPACRPSLRLASLGGFAYDLSLSETEPGKIAVAVGDNTLRVW
jgi:WD40 repeat protein